MITDDAALLRRYVSERSQEAFTEFVHRHLPFVFSAAARRLNGDVHRASEVSQIVFAAVARDARRLSRHPALVGWLYTATRHAVIDLVRMEKRRLVRDQRAHYMQAISTSTEHPTDWQKLRPIIDEVLDNLPTRDREVVLLRFFQAQAYPEIGHRLGISDEAARKRVERALDGLRNLLTYRGISSTSAALAIILGSETIVAAPAGLATSIVSSAFVGSASVASIAFMTVTKIQVGIMAALLLGGAVGLIWQHQTIAELRTARAEAQSKADEAAAENIDRVKAGASAEGNATRLHADIASLREQSEVRDSSAATSATSGRLSLGVPTVTAVPRDPRQLTQLHQRYDPFLNRWGFTPAQRDRWIELMLEKENIRLDLQDAMRDLGVRGGSKEIEALRSRFTDPPWKQMKDMLGEEGFAAFNDYEEISAYRGYLNPLNPQFSAANAALSAEQSDRLLRTIIANNHPQRKNPTDLGSASQIDWASVERQTNSFLNPTQQIILSAFVQREGGR